jgi:hypothetical protein
MLPPVQARATLLVTLALGCGATVQPVAAPSSLPAVAGWRSPPADPNRVLDVAVAPDAPPDAISAAITERARKSGSTCASFVVVWGDARVDERAFAIRISAPHAEALCGWLLCESDLLSFLAVQRKNPRIGGGAAHVGEVFWKEGQLSLRRTWSPAAAPLGDLSSVPEGVLQKNELLAVLFDQRGSDRAPAERLIDVFARVPRYFLFGIWPIR